ncbi:MAG: amidohydrolase family protein [Cyclobacteriaceae bacterium]|nr:amidohydrolase family protein [Cyclobacteriaceae bacterium]
MKILLTLLSVCIAHLVFAAADTTRYSIVTTEKISGKQLMWSDAPGKISYLYQYNDRGRGPKLRVDLTISNGEVIYRKGTGVDYFKGAVMETYENSGGIAKWKNSLEDDQRKVTGPVLYSPYESVPGEIEWMLKLLMKQHIHEMETLPAGKLKATHIKNHSAKVNGFPEELELYSFTGSGGPPEYVWVTPKHEFFASIGGWMSTIKFGFEFLIPELKKLQDEMEEDYFTEQSLTFTQKPNTPVAIKNVSVFDSKTGKVSSDQTVVIDKGKILKVGKTKNIEVLPGYKVIEGKGKMLLPGLWDNHSHFDMTQGLYHLAAGVTNIKDMANSLDLPEIKKKVDSDELMGPEISVMSGFVDFAGPYAGPTGKIVKTLEEGLAGINYYADHGYQQIKLYSSIPVDWVKPLAAEAHKRGMKVCGHVPSFMTAERAINDGYDQIIHLNMIMLNFMGDSIDTRSMGRFIKVGERAKNIDLNSPAVKKFIQLLKDKKIVVDPTAAIFEGMFVNEPGKLAAGYESIQSTFPAEYKRGLYHGGLPTMKGREADYRQSYDKMLKMLQMLYANGVTFVPGTDDFPGFALQRELELYAKAGVPNAEVLRKATYISAQVAGKDAELGSIEVGKKANLILVDGDPVKNISDIRKVDLTIKNGHLYDPKAMYASYGFGFWK